MIDISNSRVMINKDLLNCVYEFEEKWIPKLDNMEMHLEEGGSFWGF